MNQGRDAPRADPRGFGDGASCPFTFQDREEDSRNGEALMLSGDEVAMITTDARLPFSEVEILGVDVTLCRARYPVEVER